MDISCLISRSWKKPEDNWFDDSIEELVSAEGMNHLIYLLTEEFHDEDMQMIERIFEDLDGNIYIYEIEDPEKSLLMNNSPHLITLNISI